MRRKEMNVRKIIAILSAFITGGLGIASLGAQSVEAAMTFN
jgi:hypothetical protein